LQVNLAIKIDTNTMNILKRINLLFLGVIFTVLVNYGVGAQTLSDALSKGEALALSAGVGGQVARVLVKTGEQVKKGQLLLELGSTTYQSQLDAARSKQAFVSFKLQLLEEDYARQQELHEEGSFSTVELQLLELKVKQARSELAAAKIYAPVDGQITAVPLVGQRVSTNAGLSVLIRMILR
jgi:membrane fusion protein (multidrug efflux system)